ncbi:MAG: HDOD domain-containing protein [Solidesulfovibrio sp. DCME]|uniref:HDOD domain-containing protein n=1 Tax=Solidesulfovibrio sp. DCME TaxID=3447380 RepID=UPI003D0E6861
MHAHAAAPSGNPSPSSAVDGFTGRFLAFGEPLRPRAMAVPQAVKPLGDLLGAGTVSLADIHPPPLPEAYLALRRVAQDPMSSTADVAAALSMDPALASYVLRLANSALYTPSAKVETVSRAVSVIGLGEIETMAAGSMLTRVFDKPPRPELLALDAFWRHAVAVGMLARALAERVGERGGERYFVAGLLHDIGRLVLTVAEPDLAALVLARAAAQNLPTTAAERLELGFDHANLGGRIAEKWRLPESLCQAVAGHHDPALCPDNLVAAAVHAADFMANALGVRGLAAAGLPRLDERVLPAFNLVHAEPEAFWELLEQGLSAMTALVAP